jgi:hypothetical protein
MSSPRDTLLSGRRLTIATRESRLALWQARHVQALLADRFGIEVELLGMTTRGDQILDRALSPRSAARACSSRSSRWRWKKAAPTSPCIR